MSPERDQQVGYNSKLSEFATAASKDEATLTLESKVMRAHLVTAYVIKNQEYNQNTILIFQSQEPPF